MSEAPTAGMEHTLSSEMLADSPELTTHLLSTLAQWLVETEARVVALGYPWERAWVEPCAPAVAGCGATAIGAH